MRRTYKAIKGMKIKICGLRLPDNICDTALLEPDYMGFIFYPESRRFTGGHTQPADLRCIGQDTIKTGVFVNEKVAAIVETARKYKLSALQLHGNEPPEDCRRLKNMGYTVIKAFPVSGTTDFLEQKEYQQTCDYFLFDTLTEGFGGSGLSFNWEILSRYNLSTPFFLSGGLGLHNIERVMQFSHPMLYGLDFNSMVESGPGIKDPELVRIIIEKIKFYERI